MAANARKSLQAFKKQQRQAEKAAKKQQRQNARAMKQANKPDRSFGDKVKDVAVNATLGAVTGRTADGSNLMRGENHGVLQVAPNKFVRANYMGPGTQVVKRLARGDKGRTPVDKVAKQHDIDYTLAKTPEDVTAADRKMIKRVKYIQNRKLDYPINTKQANLIKMKRKAEKVLGHNRLRFADLKGPETEGARRVLLMNKKPLYGVA